MGSQDTDSDPVGWSGSKQDGGSNGIVAPGLPESTLKLKSVGQVMDGGTFKASEKSRKLKDYSVSKKGFQKILNIKKT